MSGIDIRYNATTNRPEWSPRGADSFVPFDSGIVKAFAMASIDDSWWQGVRTSRAGYYIYNSDGTINIANYPTKTSDDFANACELITSATGNSLVLAKGGYYFWNSGTSNQFQGSVIHKSVGDILIHDSPYPFVLMYLGETNPLE